MAFKVPFIASTACRPLRKAQAWMQSKRAARALAAQHYDPVPVAPQGSLLSLLTSRH